MEDVYLTLDVDWAPDAAIEATAEILERAGCPATWFVTHETPALERLRARPELHELGIHPNFLPGSSHGSEPAEVLRNALEIAPEARCLRTHAAFQSGPVLKLIRALPQIRLDCSVMLPGLANAAVVPYEDGESTLWRLPYFWSDDYEAEMKPPDWELEGRLGGSGIKVLAFHPIHVALNSAGIESYARLKGEAPDVSAWSGEQIAAARNEGPGSGSLFERLARELGERGRTLGSLIPEG